MCLYDEAACGGVEPDAKDIRSGVGMREKRSQHEPEQVGCSHADLPNKLERLYLVFARYDP
jgi:hypothetical protein